MLRVRRPYALRAAFLEREGLRGLRGSRRGESRQYLPWTRGARCRAYSCRWGSAMSTMTRTSSGRIACPCSFLILVLPFCDFATRAGCQVSKPPVSRQRSSTRVPGSGVLNGITSSFGGREGAVVGSEVFNEGSCERPGSAGEHVSGLVGDDGPVEGSRVIGGGWWRRVSEW